MCVQVSVHVCVQVSVHVSVCKFVWGPAACLTHHIPLIGCGDIPEWYRRGECSFRGVQFLEECSV